MPRLHQRTEPRRCHAGHEAATQRPAKVLAGGARPAAKAQAERATPGPTERREISDIKAQSELALLPLFGFSRCCDGFLTLSVVLIAAGHWWRHRSEGSKWIDLGTDAAR